MDKYDRQIQDLLTGKRNISLDWQNGRGLFQMAWRGDRSNPRQGCLTMIKHRSSIKYQAITPELTDRICQDERIPCRPQDIRPEHFPIFAEYQRELDKTFGTDARDDSIFS